MSNPIKEAVVENEHKIIQENYSKAVLFDKDSIKIEPSVFNNIKLEVNIDDILKIVYDNKNNIEEIIKMQKNAIKTQNDTIKMQNDIIKTQNDIIKTQNNISKRITNINDKLQEFE